MKKYFFTLHDINEEIIERADSYLRTVIINKKRYYIHKHTKLSRYGITIYELDKFDSNLSYIDIDLDNIESTIFYVKGNCIPIHISEIADALSELPETYLQVLMQSSVLKVPIEEIAREFGVSKRMINIYKRKAIETLRKKLKDYVL